MPFYGKKYFGDAKHKNTKTVLQNCKKNDERKIFFLMSSFGLFQQQRKKEITDSFLTKCCICISD